MALFDWLRPRSPLQSAIRTGLAPGGDLAKALDDLDKDTVRSRGDGEAVCTALRAIVGGTIRPRADGSDPALSALVSLFQSVEDPQSPGFNVLVHDGLPLLVQIVDDALEHPGVRDAGGLLFAMKILAMYGSDDGAASILRAARMPLAPEKYLWSVILGAFSGEHPHTRRMFEALADPLPPGFIAVSLLDAANSVLMNDASIAHPFDSDNGIERLRQWLIAPDPDVSSYGVSAAAALPLLKHPRRDELLSLAMDHPSATVRMESAWAAGKLGREDGVRHLAALALDLDHSDRACGYLAEIGRADAIPAAAREPAFAARAQFAAWLAHPNELNRAPDEVEVVDHRVLPWPPESQPTPLWLLRYRVRDTTGLQPDDIGVGLVGGMMFCLFGAKLDQRPPEDGYGVHCCWELEGQKRVRIDRVNARDGEYDALLGDWVRRDLQSPRVLAVAEIDPDVRLAGRMVAVGSATRDGEPGWFVSDGRQGHWYPQSSQPESDSVTTILQLHIGRQVLGLGWDADRKAWLRPEAPIPPAQIVTAYEKLLTELETAPAHEIAAHFDFGSQLEKHFDTYVDALCAVRSIAREAALLQTYGRCVAAAQGAENPSWPELANKGYFFTSHFEPYVDALAAAGRTSEIRALAHALAPVWDHNLGYGLIGRAAFLAGEFEKAEQLLVRLQAGLEDWERCEELSFLAEIWIRRGETARARELLIEAMRRLIQSHASATGSDLKLFAGWFRTQRDAFLRLFPEGEAALSQAGIPSSLPDS